MKKIDKIKYLFIDKAHQMLIRLMIVFMLLSNLPTSYIMAEDDGNDTGELSQITYVLTKKITTLDGDEYTFAVNADETVSDGSTLQATQISNNSDEYAEYSSQISSLFAGKNIEFVIYNLAIAKNGTKTSLTKDFTLDVEKNNKNNNDYNDTVVIVLGDEPRILNDNDKTFYKENDLNLAFVNEVKEEETDYVTEIKAVYEEENDYQKNTQLVIEEIKEDDEKYIKENNTDIDDFSIVYLRQYEFSIKDQNIPENTDLSENGITVTLTLAKDKIEQDTDDLGIVVFGDNDEKNLIKPEDIEKKDKAGNALELSFEVTDPCLFALVEAKSKPAEDKRSDETENEETDPENDDITLTNGNVTVVFSPETGISAEAELRVSDLTDESDEHKGDFTEDIYKLYDISIWYQDEKCQPAEGTSVNVQITLPESTNRFTEISVYHLSDTASLIESTAEDNTVSFTTAGFSLFAIVRNVEDITWGDYSYNIDAQIMLDELFNRLGITQITTADVAQVSFSDSASLTIEQTETDWSLTPVSTFDDGTLTLLLINGQEVTISLKNKHNPKISISASEYDPDSETITYTVTLEAEGDISSQIKVTDLTQDEDSGLSFVSGLVDGTDDFSFPYIVSGMSDGQRITLTYTVNVEDIQFNGSQTNNATIANTVSITNEGNEWNDPSDDSASVSKQFTYRPITKELASLEGNWATWTITVNPKEYTLNGGSSLTLKDTFTDNQSIDYASISAGNDVTYDYSGRTGTFVIPDRKQVTISYRTRIISAPGANVDFGNEAVIYNSSDEPIGSAKTEEQHVIYPSASDVGGTTGDYRVRIYVYEDANMQTGIGGAQFILMDETRRPMTFKKGDNAGQTITFTTDSTGYVDVHLDEEEDDVKIEKNTAYYLEMIRAPYGYRKDTTLYSFMITDDPGYESGGVWTYYNGDTLKVRLYPEEASVNVSLRFSGNYDLSSDDQNDFTVILEKKNGESWEEIERHTYDEFSYGSITFDAGKSGSNLEIGETYRIEQVYNTWVIPQSVHVTTTHYLSIGSGESQNSSKPIEFTVTNDNYDSSFNIVINNELELYKLSITKMDKESGAKLAGAEFRVFKVNTAAEDDDTQVGNPYVTDSTGLLEISGGAGFSANTLYYIVETKAPEGYLLPITKNRIYFYFCNDDDLLPSILENLPQGETATDLLKSFNTVSLDNQKEEYSIPVMKIWQGNEWPENVNRVIIGLYKTVGSDTEPVSTGKTVGLTRVMPYNDTVFVDLPARHENNQVIKYSIKEEHVYDTHNEDIMDGYVQEYGISDAGVYIVRNKIAITLEISKQWYDGESQITDSETLAAQPKVAVDVYRSSTKISDEIKEDGITNEELEAFISGLERVRSGLRFDNEDNWHLTISDLPRFNDLGGRYYYYVHETVPSFGDEIYEVDEENATVTIKNQRAPEQVAVTVKKIIKDDPRESAGTTDFEFTLSLNKGNHPIREFTVAEGLTTDWNGEVTFTLKNNDSQILNLPVGVNAAVSEAINNEYSEVASSEDLEDLNTDNRIFEFAVDPASAGKTIKYTNTLRVVCKVKDNNNEEHPYESFRSLLDFVRTNPALFSNPIKIEMLADYIMPENDVFNVLDGEEIILTTAGTDDELELKFHTDRTDYPNTALVSRGNKTLSMLVNEGKLTLNNIIIDGSNTRVTTDGGLVSNSSILNIEENTILRNSNVDGIGGAVYSTGTINMSGGIIEANKATAGSAIYLSSSILNISDGDIRNNTCTTEDGAVAVDSLTSKINLSGSPVIFDNRDNSNNWADIYLSVDSDFVINVVSPGLDPEAKIGVKGIINHREIGDQFANATSEYTQNLNCFINDEFEYRAKLKDGTTTNIVWDGLTLKLKKIFENKGGNTNDTFTITLTSTSIRKNSYTINGNLDYTVTAARANTPGSIVFRNVKANNNITIYPLPVGTYTIEEETVNYTPGFEGMNNDTEESFVIENGSFSLQGNSTVTVANTRKLTKLYLTKTIEDRLMEANEEKEFAFNMSLEDANGDFIQNYDLGDMTTDQFGRVSFVMSPSNNNSIRKIFDIPVGAVVTVRETEDSDYRISISANTSRNGEDTGEIIDEDTANAGIFKYHASEDDANIVFNNIRKMENIELRSDLIGKVSEYETIRYELTLLRKDGSTAANYTLYEDEVDVTKNIVTDANGKAVIVFTYGTNETSNSIILTVPDGAKLRVLQDAIKKDVDGTEVEICDTTHSVNGGVAISGLETIIESVGEHDRSIVYTNSRKMRTINVSNTVSGYSGNTMPFTFIATVTDGNDNDYDLNDFTDGRIQFELATGQSRTLTVPYGTAFKIEERYEIGYETIIKRGSDTLPVGTDIEFSVLTNETLQFTNNQLITIVLENNTALNFEDIQVYTEYGSRMYRVNEAGDGIESVPMTNHWATVSVEAGKKAILQVNHKSGPTDVQAYTVKGRTPESGYYYTIVNEPSYHEFADPAILRVYNNDDYEVKGRLRYSTSDSTITFSEQILVNYDANDGTWVSEMDNFHELEGSDRQVYQYTVSSGELAPRPEDSSIAYPVQGIEFLGWTTDETYAKSTRTEDEIDQSKAYDFTTPVSGPLTLYAVWKLDRTDRIVTVKNATNNDNFTISVNVLQNNVSIDGYPRNITLNKGETINLTVPNNSKMELNQSNSNCFAVSSEFVNSSTLSTCFTIADVNRNGTVSFVNGICKITDGAGNILYDNTGKPAVYPTLAAAFNAYNGTLFTDASHNYEANQAMVKMLIDEYAISSKHPFPTKNVTLTTAGKNDADFPYLGIREYATLYRDSSFTNDCMFTLENTAREVTLENIIIDGKNVPVAQSVLGGMIYFDQASGVLNIGIGTTMRNVVFAAYTDGNKARGGAIYMKNGTLNVKAGLFSNLHARRGGALSADGGTLNVSGEAGVVRFENCMTHSNNDSNNGGDGGAIFYQSSNSNVVIGGNNATNNPVIFSGCVAGDKWGDGGAIFADTGYLKVVTIRNCTFIECSARNDTGGNNDGTGGGAINAFHVSKIEVSESNFDTCDSLRSGGAVASTVKTNNDDNNRAISFIGCVFTNCKSKGQGGSIAVYQDNNSASDSKTEIYVLNCNFTDSSSGTINGSGGAIQSYVPCLHFENSNFTDCWAGKEGGAVNNWYGSDSACWTNSYMNVINCHFIRCRAEDRYEIGQIYHYGGGIATKAEKLTIDNSYFEDCVSTLQYGGAVFCSGYKADSIATVKNSIFKNCQSKNSGGAISVINETLKVENTRFYGCSSFENNGGAIYHGKVHEKFNAGNQKKTEIFDCYFTADPNVDNSASCSAAKDGGAIWTRAKNVRIENSTIRECEASGYGGAVFHKKDGVGESMTIAGGLIESCKAINGSAVYTEIKATFSNANITGNICSDINSAAIHGGTLYFEYNTKVVNNPCSSDSYMHDVLMQNNNTTTIYTTENCLGEQAYIGVYVPDTYFNNRGLEGKAFGTWVIENDFLECFFNDRDDGLSGYQASATDKNIYWGRYLCKITDSAGNTLKRANGRDAVYQRLRTALDDFTSVTGTPVYIKMLVEEYTIFQTETINNFPNADITLTTAGKDDPEHKYRGAEGTVCTISRVNSNNQLFNINNSNATLRLKNITLDGRKDITSTTGDLRLIQVTNGTLIINEGTTMQYGVANHGGAIYSENGSVIINGKYDEDKNEASVRFLHCSAKGDYNGGAINANILEITNDPNSSEYGTEFVDCFASRGGAIHIRGLATTIDGILVSECYAKNEGGGFYHDNNNSSSRTEIENSRFENCYTINNDQWSYGGAICSKAHTLAVSSSEFEGCYSKSSGGAINHGQEKDTTKTLIVDTSFVNCKTTGTNNSYGYGGSVYTRATDVEVTDCSFVNSEAFNNGGALYCYRSINNDNCKTTISGTEFENCRVIKADGKGGAISNNNKYLVLKDSDKKSTVINACSAPLNSGAVHMFDKNDNGNFKPVISISDNTIISNCYAKEGAAVYLINNATMNISGSPEFTRNGYTSEGVSAVNGACIYLVEGSVINLSGSPRFSRNNLTDRDRIYNGGIEDFVRQDIYLAGYEYKVASSINIVGELTGDTIWIWPEKAEHRLPSEQFAITSSSVNEKSLEKLRNALPDSVTGCTNGEFLAGVRLGSDTTNVYWSKMYNVFFRKIDNKAVAVAGALFNIYRDVACSNLFASAESADGITDTSVQGELLPKGTVDYPSIPIGAYYMKETAPASFLPNDTVYLVLVGTAYLSNSSISRELWIDGGPLDVPGAENLVTQSTTALGKYYGIYPLDSNGKADLSKNLALSNIGISNTRNDYQAWFMKTDESGALPNAGFTIYAQKLNRYGVPEYYENGYPVLTLWTRDGENYPDPVISADGTSYYKKIDGTTVPKGMVYFRELPTGTYFLLEEIYPERNGNNRRTSYVVDDHVLKLVVSGENNFALYQWQEQDGGTYTEVSKDGNDNYVVTNKEAACKLTDASDNLLYVLGHDGSTLLPAVYSTLGEGFDAAKNFTFKTSNGSDITANASLKLKALKDFEIDSPIEFESNRQLTFTTAERTGTDKDKYVFFTNRTTDISRAEIKRNYSEDTSTDVNNGALISILGGSNLIMQNINLDGQKGSFNGRAVHVTQESTLTILDNTQFINFKVEAAEDSTDTNDVKGGAILMDDHTNLVVNGETTYRSAVFANNEVINNRTSGSTGAFGGAIEFGEECTVNLVNAQFTGNKASAAVGNKGDGGAIHLNKTTSAQITTPLRNVVFRNNTASNDGGAVSMSENTYLVVDNSVFQSNKANSGNGGAISLLSTEEGRSELTVNGGSFTSNTAVGNGGAINVGDYGKLTLAGSLTMSSNSAVNGAAVYSEDHSELYISGGNISRNTASGDLGGAINVETADVRIYFSGTPTIFNNTKNNAQRNVVLSFDSNEIINTTSGGLKQNAKIGIYVIDGDDDKTIYNEHGVLKMPFGTFTSADHLEVFVNDRNLSLFGGRNDKDDTDVLIYWFSKGAPVAFTKIDGFGNPLAAATFTLYTDRNCTQEYKIDANTTARATSADGRTTKNENGDILKEGTVLFENIPENVYYMKETTSPGGFVSNGNIYIILVGEDKLTRPTNTSGTIWANNGVLANITQPMVNDQRTKYNNNKSRYYFDEDTLYAIFLIDSATGKAVTSPDIAQYGVLNTSDRKNMTILRKIDGNSNPLPNAQFDIYRADMTLVSSKDINNNVTTRFTSGTNGVYFIDSLPYGTYYLHEVVAPSSSVQWWYTVTVDANGTKCSEKRSTLNQ